MCIGLLGNISLDSFTDCKHTLCTETFSLQYLYYSPVPKEDKEWSHKLIFIVRFSVCIIVDVVEVLQKQFYYTCCCRSFADTVLL